MRVDKRNHLFAPGLSSGRVQVAVAAVQREGVRVPVALLGIRHVVVPVYHLQMAQASNTVKAENRGVVVIEAGSYSRLIDLCITQLEAQGPSRPVTRVKNKKYITCLRVES